MSTPIKPPGGGPPRGADVPASDKTPSVRKDEFAKTLDLRGTAAKQAAEKSRATDPVRQIAEEVRTGQLDPAVAIDRLIERAVTTGAASALGPEKRRELEALLRSALADDPTLAGMVKDLERGR